MKLILEKPIKIATPRRNMQCIAFTATAALVAVMVAQGIRVRLNYFDRWHYVAPVEDIGKGRLWELLQDSRFKYIAVVTFLVSPTGSNQTFNVPTNWNSGGNKVESIGGAGSGAAAMAVGNVSQSSGGGAGAYAAQTNIALTPGGTATYQIGPGGNGVTVTNSGSAGNAGGQTWFNGTTFGASSVGADNGRGGAFTAGINNTAAGAAGGLATNSIGATKADGGGSGSATNVFPGTNAASGGGGAGGPNGAGTTSSNVTNNFGSGGSADNGTVAGGAGGNPTGSNGNSGTEFDASHGCGSGGGGATGSSTTVTSGNGALYGGGSGGAAGGTSGSSSAISGGGGQGLIVVTNTPATRAIFAGIIG